MKVDLGPERTDVECEKCGDGLNASNSDLGTALVAEFIKGHKCFESKLKGRKK